MTSALLDLVKAISVPFGLLALARTLIARLDDRGLFQVAPFSLLPAVAGAGLEFAALRASGLWVAFDPLTVWSPGSIWEVSWNELVARLLAPEMLLRSLAQLMTTHDRQARYALLALALALLATSLMSALAWRSAKAWRGPFLLALQAFAWMTLAHLALVIAFWIIHWLNFWLLFLLLLFVEMRRHEGEGSKYQAS